MNVWEYLGLPSDHRPDNKTVQLVKHYDQVKTEKIKFPCLAQRKYDGVFGLAVYLGAASKGWRIFSRTGKEFTNTQEIRGSLTDGPFDPSAVYIFEICCDEVSLEQLSGLVNPNRKKPLTEEEVDIIQEAYIVLHDVLSLDGFIKGREDVSYKVRSDTIMENLSLLYPEECEVVDHEHIQIVFDYAMEKGWEGVVVKQMDAGWVAGRRDHEATKLVKGVDFDLLVLDVEEGKGKRSNMVANLIVRWKAFGEASRKETVLPVDGRFTDEQRIAWWEKPSDIIGQVVHVHALAIGSKGSLRLPKVHSVRIDKTEPDL